MKPGYKQTEMGVIPEGWDVKPFAELFAFRNGVNADKASYGQGVFFINVLEPITYSHIYGPEITGQVTLPDSVIASYAVCRGDVLFNRTSETQEEVALAATYLGTERVVFGGFVIRGRPLDQRLDPVYSGYALRAPFIRSQIIPMGQGAVRANVGQQNLGLVIAPIPPLAELHDARSLSLQRRQCWRPGFASYSNLFLILVQEWRMAERPIASMLTHFGGLLASPTAFLIVLIYAALWFVFERNTFDWHAVATLATWLMTLIIQRSEHRDTQAIHAKLDEVLRTLEGAQTGLAKIDDEEPEDIEKYRQEVKDSD